MLTVTITKTIARWYAAEALRQQLGNGCQVTTHGAGAGEAAAVKHGSLAFATVHLTTATRPQHAAFTADC